MEGGDVQVDLEEEAYRGAYRAYMNHIMGCRECYAPNHRYCALGEPLLLEADARYLMTVPDRAARNRTMVRDFKLRPAYANRLAERFTELFEQRKEG